MLSEISIVRYKKDLRVADHKPLYKACQQDFPVIALYIWEPSIMQAGDYSHFQQYWIQQSLKDLKQSLQQINIPLLMYHGEVSHILDHIQQYYSIRHIYAHEETGNDLSFQRDKVVINYCKKAKILFTEYPTNAVVRRLSSRNDRERHRKESIFTPIYTVPTIQVNRCFDTGLQDICKNSFTPFQPATKPQARIYDREIPGEQAGQNRLQHFLSKSAKYQYALSRPELAMADSSRLSAYITYGNLTIKQIYQATTLKMSLLAEQSNLSADEKTKQSFARQIRSINAFRSRLHRHCHFIQKLESQPSIEVYNQNRAFDKVRADSDDALIQARYHGRTGIPIIDAGMRCLHATGWINFRMRATLVSFICNTCMQPRQAIAHILAKIFVDYEPGIHYSQLQMQSGTTGINTIRIYNPIKQLSDKDEDLTFVRKRIPELADLTSDEVKLLGTPAGTLIIYDKNHEYSVPIVDVIQSNREARIQLRGVMKQDDTRQLAKKVFEKLGSRKRPASKKKKPIITQDSLFGDI